MRRVKLAVVVVTVIMVLLANNPITSPLLRAAAIGMISGFALSRAIMDLSA